MSLRQALKLNIGHASNDCWAFFVPLFLSILFISHLSISIVITYQLYNHSFMILFGFHISVISFVFFGSWITAIMVFQGDEDLRNPQSPFILILYFITAGKCDIVENSVSDCYKDMNRRCWCCNIINYMLYILLLSIFLCFTPLYTVSFIIRQEDRDDFPPCIYYQMALIIPNTILQIIIICLAIKSIPFLTVLLCIIGVGIGITYLIIFVFLSFGDLMFSNVHHQQQYEFCLPFMINLELLLLLSMVFIISLTQNALVLVLFINMIFPNLPFFKSYLINIYCDILNKNECLEDIVTENNSLKRMDKMFCVLLFISYKKSIADNEETHLFTKKNISIIEQYKYDQMKMRDKRKLIDSHIKANENVSYSVWMEIVCVIHICSSCIALISPFGCIIWITWITIMNEYQSPQFIVAWCVVSYCYMVMMGLYVYMIAHKIMMTWQKIKYVWFFKGHTGIWKPQKQDVLKYYDRFPTINVVFQQFQYDIAMIIALYLFE